LMVSFLALAAICGCEEAGPGASQITNQTVDVTSGELIYPAYISAPFQAGKYPGIVLMHSFNGLEPGYKTMVDDFASLGFVVIAPEWQTHNRTPADEIVAQLINDTAAHLKSREDVDGGRMGLTGFCAGGRYTMLFLPQMQEFKSGVAWYGFPQSGGFNNESAPVEFIDQLRQPMLIIHGTRDVPSPVSGIYNYATMLDASDKYFELKVYQGQPHGFMITDGQLSETFQAQDAFGEMVNFFNRTLSI